MRIPDGDLMPRRRRRHATGYGVRRRRRRMRRLTAVVALLLAGAAAAWFVTRPGSAKPVATGSPCPTPSPTPAAAALPAPGQVRVAVLNGTSHNGLAAQVATALRSRGFVVLSATNAPAPQAGPSEILFGAGAQPQAAVLGQQVPGAGVAAAAGVPAGQVRLLLGSAFTGLASPAPAAVASSPPAATARVCPG